jgi:hypothetical protein
MQFTGFAVVQAPRPRGGILNLGEDLAAIGKKLLSRRRQADAAVGAGKQPGADLLLEDLNLLAQRRLGDIQPRRRVAKMELFGDGNKVAQVAQLDIHI